MILAFGIFCFIAWAVAFYLLVLDIKNSTKLTRFPSNQNEDL